MQYVWCKLCEISSLQIIWLWDEIASHIEWENIFFSAKPNAQADFIGSWFDTYVLFMRLLFEKI
jgi:hypothetical protein